MTQEVVRVTLPPTLKTLLKQKADRLGIKDTEYVKSLIIEDMKK